MAADPCGMVGAAVWPPPGGVRPLDERDDAALAALLTEPDVARWVPEMRDATTAPGMLRRYLSTLTRLPEPFGLYGAFDAAGLMAEASLSPAPDGRVLLSYAARTNLQGGGCATRLSALVLIAAAERRPHLVVTCTIEPENGASLRVAEKLGFRCIGDRPYYGPTSSGRTHGPFFERNLRAPRDDLVALASLVTPSLDAASEVAPDVAAWRRRLDPAFNDAIPVLDQDRGPGRG